MKALLIQFGVLAAFAVLPPVLFGDYGIYFVCALCAWGSFALAYDIAFGRTGLVSFGHAIFFGVGAYAFVLAIADGGFSFWPALLAGVACATVVAFLVGVIALRVSGHAFVIITVIFGGIFELAAYSSQEITNGEDGRTFALEHIDFGLFQLSLLDPWSRYALFLAAFIFVFLLCRWIGRSTLGLVLTAIRQNERRAALLGYPTRLYKLAAFTISGTLSGLAGVLFSLLSLHVTAEIFQITVSIQPLTAALVGGAGTVLGPVIGTVLVFALSDLLRSVIVYSEFFIGVVLVATVLVAPKGLVDLFTRAMSLRRHRAPQPVRDAVTVTGTELT